MIRLTKLDRAQISEFAKSPQQIKYFEALQSNVSELPDAIAILTAAVAEAQFDADIAQVSANEALTLANQKGQDDFLPEMVIQPMGGSDAISSATFGAATKATPVDADLIPLVDSAASYTLKNLTWANLKATLKTYFDSVVTTLTNKTLTAPVINGGSIDNATVGATTANTGRFTTVTTTTAGSSIVVEAFTAPTFLNSWVNFGGAFNNAGYYKDSFGIVHLRGLVKDGVVNTPIFTLPAGYRPSATELFPTDSNGAHAQITVSAAGDVVLATGSNVYASIDGMTFKAA